MECSHHSTLYSHFFWLRPERESDSGIKGITAHISSSSQPTSEIGNKTTTRIVVPKILEKIGFCESGNQQFEKDGTVKRGKQNRNDIGKYQINLIYWGAEARSLGYDIYSLDGNTRMALHILSRYGTAPWNWSKISCWGKLSKEVSS